MPKIVKRPTSCQAPIAARLGASADRAYRAGQPRRPKTLQYWLRNGPAMGAGPSICQSPPLLGVGDRRSGAGSEALLFEVGGLTTEVQNAALHLLQCVFSEFSMNVVVDLILNEYQSIRPLDAERLADLPLENWQVSRSPQDRRAKRYQAAVDVWLGLSKGNARGSRPSVHGLLNQLLANATLDPRLAYARPVSLDGLTDCRLLVAFCPTGDKRGSIPL